MAKPLTKYSPLDLTAYQKLLHEQSTAARTPTKTRGAFGTSSERRWKRYQQRVAEIKAGLEAKV